MSEAVTDMHVMIIDDEEIVRHSMTQTLMLDGYRAQAFENPELALIHCTKTYKGIVICDVRMNIMSGLEVLKRIMDIDKEIPVIMFSAHADVAIAVQAIHIGAYDFLEKTDDPEQHVNTVQRALNKRQLILENRQLRQSLQNQNQIEYRLIGQAPSMQRLRESIVQLANMDVDLIINGETGTGKEVVARCLHDFSERKNKPFVAINCGALTESIIESELFGHEAGTFTGAVKKRIGKIEYANGGTLFLDEIESMPLLVQVRLLRVLQERSVQRVGSNTEISVDLRVVVATKIELQELVRQGEFREDLYYRLNVARVDLPNLYARKVDIPLLFEHFVQLFCLEAGRDALVIPHQLLSQLSARRWDGNVRELRNAAQRWALGLPLGFEAAAPSPDENNYNKHDSVNEQLAEKIAMSAECDLDEHMAAFEKNLICSVLKSQEGHIERTANALGVPRKKLYLRMKKYNLDRSVYTQ